MYSEFFYRIFQPTDPETGNFAQTRMNDVLNGAGIASADLIRNLRIQNPEGYEILASLGKETQEIESILSKMSSSSGVPYPNLGTLYTDGLLKQSIAFVSETRDRGDLSPEQRAAEYDRFVNSGLVSFDIPLPVKARPNAVRICKTIDRMMNLPANLERK